MDERRLTERLEEHASVAAHPGLAKLGEEAFAYANVLLDDDENLTRVGNATGAAKKLLRERIEELLASSGAVEAADLDEVDLELEGGLE